MNILITGCSRGLGRYLSDELFEQGHSVIGLARYSGRPNVPFYSCDLTKTFDTHMTLTKIFEHYKTIDVLINNASVINCKPLEQYTLEDIDETLDLNIKGTMIVTQRVLSLMSFNKKGYVINIGSTRSITSAPNKALYSMSKFAIRALTQSINIEYNRYGVYSTLLCPGAIDNTKEDKVHYEDVMRSINYLLSMPMRAKVPELIIGGQL